MFLEIKNDFPEQMPVDRYEIVMSQLSQTIKTTTSDGIPITEEMYDNALSQVVKSLKIKDPAIFLENSQLLLDFYKSSEKIIFVSDAKSLLDSLINALQVFQEDLNCVSLVFSFISVLSLQKDSLEYFYMNNVFEEALDASNSDNRLVSFEALKVISVMIGHAFRQGFEIDISQFIERLDEIRLLSREHEYYVAVICRSIIEFTDSSAYWPEIFDIVCWLLNENSFDTTLAVIADMVLVILNNDFDAFSMIHDRYAITSILFERLDENTSGLNEDDKIHFATPVLQIILLIIKNCDVDFGVRIASMISPKKYKELIQQSDSNIAYLALKIVSFLLMNEHQKISEICFTQDFFQVVIRKFIVEAAFIKKISGLLWFKIVSDVIDKIESDVIVIDDALPFLMECDVLNICSFGLDGKISGVIYYLQLVLNLIKKAESFKMDEIVTKCIQNCIENDVVERARSNLSEFENNCQEKDEEKIETITLLIGELAKYID